MQINQALTLLPGSASIDQKSAAEADAKKMMTSFGETLNKAIGDVNSLQQEAGKAVDKMVVGEDVDLHDVMIAVEKAKTSFSLLMEVRNKTLDAYRELMRITI